jgi:hypothetical protein
MPAARLFMCNVVKAAKLLISFHYDLKALKQMSLRLLWRFAMLGRQQLPSRRAKNGSFP